MSEPIGYIAFSVEQRRPGCVLIQAGLGGTFSNFASIFPSETWLTNPCGMQLYAVPSQWHLDRLVEMANEAIKKEPAT